MNFLRCQIRRGENGVSPAVGAAPSVKFFLEQIDFLRNPFARETTGVGLDFYARHPDFFGCQTAFRQAHRKRPVFHGQIGEFPRYFLNLPNLLLRPEQKDGLIVLGQRGDLDIGRHLIEKGGHPPRLDSCRGLDDRGLHAHLVEIGPLGRKQDDAVLPDPVRLETKNRFDNLERPFNVHFGKMRGDLSVALNGLVQEHVFPGLPGIQFDNLGKGRVSELQILGEGGNGKRDQGQAQHGDSHSDHRVPPSSRTVHSSCELP